MVWAYITDTSLISTKERPLFLLDSGLNCIHSENDELLSVGASINDILDESIELLACGGYRGECYRNNSLCFINSVPIKLLDGSYGYACWFDDEEDIESMVLKSRVGSQMAQLYEKAEAYVEEIRLAIGEGSQEGVAYSGLASLASLLENGKAWMRGLGNAGEASELDFYSLCDWLVERCNNALTDSGRHIDFSGEAAYIRCSHSMALAAMSNVVCNSMLCSSDRSAPRITLTSDENTVRLKVENTGIDGTVSGQEFGGIGASVIESFVKGCSGTYNITNTEDSFLLSIELPRFVPPYDAPIRLAQGFSPDDYSGNDLRLVDTMLQQLVCHVGAHKKDR